MTVARATVVGDYAGKASVAMREGPDTVMLQPDMSAPSDAVEVRTLVIASRPLLVAAIAGGQRGDRSNQLSMLLQQAGLPQIARFVGQELSKGARIGFSIEPDQLRLVDENDATLLRADRGGLDPTWLSSARRLRGTMFVLIEALSLAPQHAPGELITLIDQAAADGRVSAAIVGVAEQRPTLPLMFG